MVCAPDRPNRGNELSPVIAEALVATARGETDHDREMLASRVREVHVALKQILEWLRMLPFDSEDLAQVAATLSARRNAVEAEYAHTEQDRAHDVRSLAAHWARAGSSGGWSAKRQDASLDRTCITAGVRAVASAPSTSVRCSPDVCRTHFETIWEGPVSGGPPQAVLTAEDYERLREARAQIQSSVASIQEAIGDWSYEGKMTLGQRLLRYQLAALGGVARMLEGFSRGLTPVTVTDVPLLQALVREMNETVRMCRGVVNDPEANLSATALDQLRRVNGDLLLDAGWMQSLIDGLYR